MKEQRFRAQGLHPMTGIFTECYTNSYETAKRMADNMYFGEVRYTITDRVVYRDGAEYDAVPNALMPEY